LPAAFAAALLAGSLFNGLAGFAFAGLVPTRLAFFAAGFA
jgi:hypothetical protein